MIGANTLNRIDYHRLNGFVVKRDKLPKQKKSDLQKFINHLSQNKPYNPNEDLQAIEMRRFRDFLERRNEFTDLKASTQLNKWISELKNAKITDVDQQKAFIEKLIKDGENMESIALLTTMMKTGQLNRAIEGDKTIDYKKLAEELRNLLITNFDELRIDSSLSEDRNAAKLVISYNERIKNILKDKYPKVDRKPLELRFFKLGDAKIIIDRLNKPEADAEVILNRYKLEEYPRTFEIVLSEVGKENAIDAIKQELTTQYGFRDVSDVDAFSDEKLNKLIEVLNNAMFSFKSDNIGNVIDAYNA